MKYFQINDGDLFQTDFYDSPVAIATDNKHWRARFQDYKKDPDNKPFPLPLEHLSLNRFKKISPNV